MKGEFQLKRFKGKGGWTYAELPDVSTDPSSPFGWRLVKGSIDHVQLKRYHLMPMGNGHLFLPVKAEIRKKIRKQAGDVVRVILFEDRSELEVPLELQESLGSEPGALQKFMAQSDGIKHEFIRWIYDAKTPETRVKRILRTIDMVLKGDNLRSSPKEQVL